ncbi:MAG: PAS domain-containing protein, partial [Steroidobacteraceae bacterium]
MAYIPSSSAAQVNNERSGAPPVWIDRLCIGLVIYVVICSVWMITGLGGENVRHYVGLLGDTPASLAALIVTITATRRMAIGTTRTAWACLSLALAMYVGGTTICIVSWLQGRDPFPGYADVFFLAFYPVFMAAVGLMIRAAAVKIRWTQFLLDATVLVTGFGTFFWFLIIRPASSSAEIDFVKYTLSLVYIALNCVLVLGLGVLLLASASNRSPRSVPLLLTLGFTTMLLGDVMWSVAKITGHYLSGDIQDVLYVACYLPMAVAGREQMRMRAPGTGSSVSHGFAQALPYAAMLTALGVLASLTHGGLRSPATIMTLVVFALALLVMVRQALAMREEALTRERRAARLVEERYASLIANASDVILTVDADGTLMFASPACERTLGLRPEEVAGKNLIGVWAGEDADRLRAFLGEVAATSGEPVGPVEMRIERGRERYVLEIVGSNLSNDPAVQGLALNLRDITERKA